MLKFLIFLLIVFSLLITMLCLKRMLRDRPWENWPCMGFLLIISITIVGIILGIEKLQQDSNVTRPKRSLERDACLKKYGGIELSYTKGSTTSFTFDLCSVIKCGGRNSSWRGYDVYLCQLGYPGNQRWCPTWDHVLQATNRDFQGSTDKVTSGWTEFWVNGRPSYYLSWSQ